MIYKLVFLIPFITLVTSEAISASDAANVNKNLLNRVIERQLPVNQHVQSYYITPSTIHFADSLSFSSAGMDFDYLSIDRPPIVQDGSGHNLIGLSAKSYHKLSSNSTVYGHAGYSTGTTRHLNFSNVIDYSTVGPFVTGDSVGGNIRHQRYDFGGGWSRDFNAFCIGLQADYRAEIAHRAIDPRVRNIVSDLSISTGISRRVGSTYLVGLNFGASIYHQDSDVDFYNPTTHAITMVYTGLGSSSNRFKGADTQNSSYRNTRFIGSLQLCPYRHGNRFYANVSAALSTNDLILNGYNNLKFGSTSSKEFAGSMSRRFSSNTRLIFFPTLSSSFFNRVATENLFSTSADNYVKIGQRQNYHHKHILVALDLPMSYRLSRQTVLSASITSSYLHDNEYLVEPARDLKINSLNISGQLALSQKLGSQWHLNARVIYGNRLNISTSAQWAGLDLTQSVAQACYGNYQMASCNASRRQTHLVVSRYLNSFVLSIGVDYNHYVYNNLAKGDSFAANISLSF